MLVWSAGALASLGVALYAYHYLLPAAVAPPGIAENPFVWPWLAIHAGVGGTALALAPLQLLPRLRARRPRLHRWIGRTYVTAAFVGGVAGLILAVGSTAGPVASWGFGLLALAWMATTAQAWRLALARRFDAHRRWMLRSFALIFAAVTLRIYLPLSLIAGLDPLQSYRAIAWLCWVPNLVAVETYLSRRPRHAAAALRAAA